MIKKQPQPSGLKTNYKRQLIVVALVVIAAIVIAPQFSQLDGSVEAVRRAQLPWVLAAAGCLLVTYPVAGLIYQILSMRPLPFGRTIIIQAASMFAGRVLPAGAGEVGVNYLYLRRQQHGRAQAAAVIATNNSLGFISNTILLGIFLLTGSPLPKVHVPNLRLWSGVAAVVLLIGILILGRTAIGRRVGSGLVEVGRHIASYRKRWWSIGLAILVALLLTVVYTLLLFTSARAIGPHISLGTAFVVMSLGVVGASVTPTPGGLGGAEAALAGSLVLYHVSTADAVATALVFRLITYWLGLVVGGGALLFARHRKYI